MEIIVQGKKYDIQQFGCNNIKLFPFYINITNKYNAKCDFCSNGLNKDYRKLDLINLKKILDEVHFKIRRVSISGGETMIDTEELNKLLDLLNEYNIFITINTNGAFLMDNIEMLNRHRRIEAIIVSRHHYDDEINNQIFKTKVFSLESFKNFSLKFPLNMNCLLIKGYIDSVEEVEKYLEVMSKFYVISRVGFISMMKVNEYTKENFVDYRDITRTLSNKFVSLGKKNDETRCSCDNYNYIADNGKIINVYFRYTEEIERSCRSLFYDCDGLRDGY